MKKLTNKIIRINIIEIQTKNIYIKFKSNYLRNNLLIYGKI